MSSIHFKFRSGSEYEPLFFDGHCISLKDFRESIISKKKMGKASDYKLEVMDSTTEKEYTNENEMIPKNTSLIIRRVPIYYDKAKELAQIKQIEASELAEIGNIAYINAPEDVKIKAIMIQSELVNQTTDSSLCKVPPSRIPICFHCKQNGHVIKNCPLIPRNTSMGKEPVHMFLKNSLGLPIETTLSRHDPIHQEEEVVPDFLCCPLCKNVFSNAVLIPCCGSSYCDHCIQDYLVDHELKCPSCEKNMSPESLVANISLRKSVETLQLKRVNKISHDFSSTSTCEESETITSNVPPAALDSVVVTSVNNMPNITNSLFSSLPFQGVASSLATSSFLMNPLLGKLSALRALSDHIQPNFKMIEVCAPFLTNQYAKSVVLGERVLTRDEFYSLKNTLARELKSKSTTRGRIRKSSSRHSYRSRRSPQTHKYERRESRNRRRRRSSESESVIKDKRSRNSRADNRHSSRYRQDSSGSNEKNHKESSSSDKNSNRLLTRDSRDDWKGSPPRRRSRSRSKSPRFRQDKRRRLY